MIKSHNFEPRTRTQRRPRTRRAATAAFMGTVLVGGAMIFASSAYATSTCSLSDGFCYAAAILPGNPPADYFQGVQGTLRYNCLEIDSPTYNDTAMDLSLDDETDVVFIDAELSYGYPKGSNAYFMTYVQPSSGDPIIKYDPDASPSSSTDYNATIDEDTATPKKYDISFGPMADSSYTFANAPTFNALRAEAVNEIQDPFGGPLFDSDTYGSASSLAYWGKANVFQSPWNYGSGSSEQHTYRHSEPTAGWGYKNEVTADTYYQLGSVSSC